MRDQLVGDVRAPLLILQCGVLLVLLIACANVANLLLMRATGRGRELAIRTTLGAGQWRLVRQMLTEGVVLSTIGGIGGLALGVAGVRGLVAMSSRQLPAAIEASLQPAVLLFTMALAVVTGLVFGVVPALAVIRGNTAAFLKDDSTRGSAGRGTEILRVVARRRRSHRRAHAARRRRTADQELRQAAAGQPRLRVRERAHRADGAAGDPLSRSGRAHGVLAAPARRVRGPFRASPPPGSPRTCRSTATSAPARTRSSATRRARAKPRRTAGRRSSAGTTSARCRFRWSRDGCSTTATPRRARGSSSSISTSSNRYFAGPQPARPGDPARRPD